MGSWVLLDLMGGVALLLWGLHMVHSGIVRAFGADLRRVLTRALGNRVSAFLAGLGITALLQSSTATALMTTAFAGEGMIGLVPALAVMLGANVGTTLIVQVLTFDVSAVAPVLLVVGVVAFKRGGKTRTRDLGRVAIGLGLMLLALHILLDTLAPAEEAPVVRSLLAVATAEPALNVLIGAAVAWAAHSSVAGVLLIMSLAYSGFVTPDAALALVLGANLGSALNPVFEAGDAGNPASRRVPVGNLINRVVGCALVLPILHPISSALAHLDPSPTRLIADFHTAFNLALGCAAREVLHMGDLVETMLRQTITAFVTDDRRLVHEISRMDDAVDRLDEAIKLYVTKVTRESLDEREGRRAMEIISFAINLEHVGDIIDKNLMELAAKKIKRKLQFSKEGAAELAALHGRVMDNVKMAFGVFLSNDAKLARQLLGEKSDLRASELAAADNHLARLREGRPESIETSSLHLDILRDLKRINSHVCSVAYSVLEGAGELERVRPRQGASLREQPVRPARPPMT